ncbi:MAG: gamma-glutamyl-gamma-aminobutyrate hydrolase family protein [Clostridia bacterium]|nr:gamma-glutamyl-gamma-aminobutyrate hydrolase family protein [Clostridia bacterium]
MGGAERPVIGVTAGLGRGEGARPEVRLASLYVEAVRAAGGAPVVVAPPAPGERLAEGEAAALVARFDGLLLTGGLDVDPARWGEPPHRETKVDAERDELEFALLLAARDLGLPILGVCRGCQVINVAFGGSLLQHLPCLSGVNEHRQTRLDPPLARGELSHEVAIAPGTRLAAVLGAGVLKVNSLHHQAVGRLGEGLRVSAQSPDGVVEGIEADGPAWIVGVQFHPEELFRAHPTFLALFRAFVAEAAAFAARGPSRAAVAGGGAAGAGL